MKRTYKDLVCENFIFPNKDFKVINNELYFEGLPLMELVRKYGTPLKINYLPRISTNIQKGIQVFTNAIRKFNYPAEYIYCYCTKANHFRFVLEEALSNPIALETSSSNDILILERLYKDGLINKDTFVVCNGFKPESYKERISSMINRGFKHVIPVLDNVNEIDYYLENIKVPFDIGIRYATDEERDYDFYTSRLGVRKENILDIYKSKIEPNKNVRVRMLHFFINTGIRDTNYYWSEFSDFIYKYCEMRKHCEHLDMINIGGGFPAITTLDFDYDYQYIADLIIENIQDICAKNDTPCPTLVTEFGTFTVGESACNIFSVLDYKAQNDKELWCMLDGSIMTQMPDIWAIDKKFVMLALNNWEKESAAVHLGGITCDGDDYYNTESSNSAIFLPKRSENRQYIGFFYTGAYQTSLGGFGGIQHCLIPTSRQLVITRDKQSNELKVNVFAEEQEGDRMLELLGY